jgi:hypothetical protein
VGNGSAWHFPVEPKNRSSIAAKKRKRRRNTDADHGFEAEFTSTRQGKQILAHGERRLLAAATGK